MVENENVKKLVIVKGVISEHFVMKNNRDKSIIKLNMDSFVMLKKLNI